MPIRKTILQHLLWLQRITGECRWHKWKQFSLTPSLQFHISSRFKHQNYEREVSAYTEGAPRSHRLDLIVIYRHIEVSDLSILKFRNGNGFEFAENKGPAMKGYHQIYVEVTIFYANLLSHLVVDLGLPLDFERRNSESEHQPSVSRDTLNWSRKRLSSSTMMI